MINTNPTSTTRGTQQLTSAVTPGGQTSTATSTQTADVASKPATGTLVETFSSSSTGQKSSLGFPPPATTQAYDPATAVETEEATNSRSDTSGSSSPGGRTSNRGTPSGSA